MTYTRHTETHLGKQLLSLYALWNTAHQLQMPVAAWKVPGQSHLELVIDFAAEAKPQSPDLQNLPKGFFAGKFRQKDSAQGQLIRAQIYHRSDQAEPTWDVSISAEQRQKFEEAYQQERRNLSLTDQYQGLPAFVENLEVQQLQRSRYLDYVARTVSLLDQAFAEKIVCSRYKVLDFVQAPDTWKVLEEVAEAYPYAFVSAYSWPGQGTWIGATPELLVSWEGQRRVLRTMSLAGTQHMMDKTEVFSAVWRSKEKEEQELVTQYIRQCLSEVGITDYHTIGPRTVAAGNVMHLKTDFTIPVPVGKENWAWQLVQSLHPTSAVCGSPRDKAEAYIHEHEGFDREYYTGFLGPVGMEGESHLFVNLRCMKIVGAQAQLFAGAGITRDSVPEQEWLETELKTRTLIDVLR